MFWAQPESSTALLTQDTHWRTTTMPMTPPSDVLRRCVLFSQHLVVLDQLPLGCPLAEPYPGESGG